MTRFEVQIRDGGFWTDDSDRFVVVEANSEQHAMNKIRGLKSTEQVLGAETLASARASQRPGWWMGNDGA